MPAWRVSADYPAGIFPLLMQAALALAAIVGRNKECYCHAIFAEIADEIKLPSGS